jgi:hypothetical protein
MVEKEELRNRITRIVASTRFPFVDQETWPKSRQTIVNDEVKRYAISTEVGVLYPNIVITDQDGSIYEIGIIEFEEEISENSVPRWNALSNIVPYGREFKKLFIYVPESYEEKTKQILDDNEVNYDGIRVFMIEHQTLKIIPYITRNDEYDHIIT